MTWLCWNKVGIIFEFSDIIYSSANLLKLLYEYIMGQSESCKKALFKFAYFVNVVVILLQSFPLHC